MSVQEAAAALAAVVVVDEARDLVRWPGGAAGLHDYGALYAVPGLYEAVYFSVLEGGSPALLAAALAEAVPAVQRPARRVLDVGAGTGMVGEELARTGFAAMAGADLEPASEVALRRDRPDVYRATRTMDLLALDEGDQAWLAEVAPDVVTAAGAVGFGHLPVEAFQVLTGLLPPGGLLAVTVARGWRTEPALAGHAELFAGPAYEPVAQRDGLHRRSASDDQLVTALVLRRAA